VEIQGRRQWNNFHRKFPCCRPHNMGTQSSVGSIHRLAAVSQKCQRVPEISRKSKFLSFLPVEIQGRRQWNNFHRKFPCCRPHIMGTQSSVGSEHRLAAVSQKCPPLGFDPPWGVWMHCTNITYPVGGTLATLARKNVVYVALR
jgi:hypothetical protein